MLISRQPAGEGSNQPANGTPFCTIMKHFETINWGGRLTNGFQIQAKFVETEKKYNKNRSVEEESSASAGMFSATVSTFYKVNPVRCWWKCRGFGVFSAAWACLRRCQPRTLGHDRVYTDPCDARPQRQIRLLQWDAAGESARGCQPVRGAAGLV